MSPDEGCPECGAVLSDLDTLQRHLDWLVGVYLDQRAMVDKRVDRVIEAWKEEQ